MKYVLSILFLVLSLSLNFSLVTASEYNSNFSYFELGAEVISYSEATSVAGHVLDMSKQVVNPVQRSGSYTPIGDDAGFYIQVATTLDALSATEEWNIAPFGVVQTNQRKVRWNDLSLLYASQFEYSGFHVVGGLNVMTLSFTRSNFQKSVGAPAFEASIAPTTFSVFPGSITEDSTNVSALIGIRYDSLFDKTYDDTRWQIGLTGGIPLYYKVENSNFPNVSWTEYFKGFDVQSNVGYAFRIYKDFFMNMQLSASYKKRPETKGVAVTGGTGRVPAVTMYNIRASLGLEWGME